MILFHGQRWDDDQLERLRGDLAGACLETLAGPPLLPETVVAACEALASRMARGDYDLVLRPLLAALGVEESQFAAALRLFTRESLERKLTVELGDAPTDLPHPPFAPIHRQRRGLGVLLHIAAGNVDGLPAYSVVEGLLAGNINILKLPAADRGVSLLLLEELTRIEPRLADFIYVFDTPSTDLASLEVFARAADAVVVWGGDEAVRSARQLAQPDTQIISWGHKLSFAYAVPDAAQEDLAALARHICLTRQLLCSSCQGIFVDTADLAEAEELGERFFHLLRSENRRASPADLGLRAKAALQLYTDSLEADRGGRRVLRGDGVSVTVAPDCRLELSLLAGNCWVKPLPRTRLVPTLRPMKGRLQTAGLLCPPAERAQLSELLARAGVCRVTEPGEMSRTVPGEAHDGMYPLAAYSRVVELS